MEELLKMLAGFAIAVLLVIFAIYATYAIFLNKFNKLVNGKKTVLAWIPIANVYLLGKLTINKTVGWILVAGLLLTGEVKIRVGEMFTASTTTYTLLPAGINAILSFVYLIALFVLFIYAIIKYNKLKKAQ